MDFSTESLKTARDYSYSDDEIYSHLETTDDRFKVAKESGYSLDEVASHFDPQEQAPEIPKSSAYESFKATLGSALSRAAATAVDVLTPSTSEEYRQRLSTSKNPLLRHMGEQQPDVPEVDTKVREMRGESDVLRKASTLTFENGASPESTNIAAKFGRGAGHAVSSMLPAVLGGELALPAMAFQGASDAYQSKYLETEIRLKNEGVDEDIAKQLAAEEGGSAAARTAPALLLYMVGGKLASSLGSKLSSGLNPLASSAIGAGTATIANVATSSVIRALEAEEGHKLEAAIPSIESLTADTLFGVYHGVGEYRNASLNAKRKAFEELQSRGFEAEDLRTGSPKEVAQVLQTPEQTVEQKANEFNRPKTQTFEDDLTYKIITPSAKQEGAWQVTSLEKEDLTPVGDTQHATEADAITAASSDARPYQGEITPVPGNNVKHGAVGSNPPPDILQQIRAAQKPRVISTAIRTDAEPVRGPEADTSHQLIIPEALNRGVPFETMEKELGFVVQDQNGERFANRDEAYDIAEQAGQLKEAAKGRLLTSENFAPGASNVAELEQQRLTFGADVYKGLKDAGQLDRATWEKNVSQEYDGLDQTQLDDMWAVAQEAATRNAPTPEAVKQIQGAEAGEGITALKNKQTDQDRRDRGLPAASEAAKRTWGAVWDQAIRTIDNDPYYVSNLINDLRDNPTRTATDLESAVLLHRKIELENQYDRAVDEINKAYESGNENAKAVAMDNARRAENDLIEVNDLARRVGSEQGRALAIRKMMVGRDYSMARMVAETRASKGGEELTPTERKEVETQFTEIQRTQKELDARLETLDQQGADQASESHFNELLKTQKPTVDVQVLSIAERIVARLDKAADAAWKRIRARTAALGRTSANPIELFDPTVLYDVAVIGASKIAKGLLNFGKWATAMKADLGELGEIDSILPQVWEQSNKMVDESVAAGASPKQRAPVKQAVTKATNEQQRENVTNAIRDDVGSGTAITNLRSMVQKLAKLYVQSGVKERNGLIDVVYADLKAIVPEITRREAMDLISGYGDFKALDKDATKATLRDLKGQMQQVAKLEDIQAKQPLKKTGIERREVSDTERRLIKEVNELKRKMGVVTTDPSKQLKGALDAIKTRLKNQIRDLGHELETGEKPPSKTQVEYDAEAERLKATRDRLAKTLSDLEEKPGLTDEQRIANTTKALERSIADYEARIRSGDTGPSQPKKTPSTPQIEALKAKRDAVKAELEEIRSLDTALQEEKAFDALIKQADKLEIKLTTHGPEAPKGEKPVDTPLVADARQRVKELQEALKAAKASSPESQKSRLDTAIKSVESSISKYDEMLQKGDVSPKARKSGPSSEVLDRLKAERDALKDYVQKVRNEAKPKADPELRKLKAFKTRTANRIAEMQDRIARGDYAPKPTKPVDISKDAEAVRLKAENTHWKKVYERKKLLNERETRTKLQKAWTLAQETLNVPRAVMSSADFSAVLRQGGMLVLGNPARAVKALGAMFRSLSEQGFERSQAQIESRGNFKNGFYKEGDLYLADTGDVKLSRMEEARMSELAEKIWIVGPIVKASNRTYVAFLNRIRADSFDAMTEALTSGKPTKQELEAIGNFINVATGRGSLGKNFESATNFLATTFFSPRLAVSRFQILSGQPLIKGYASSGRVGNAIAREYAKTMTGALVVLSLGALAGAKIEKDPRSSDFGKLKFGNARLDPFFGLSQATVLLSRIATGEKVKDGKVAPLRNSGTLSSVAFGKPLGKVPFGNPDTTDVIQSFLRSKLSPLIGAGLTAVSGKNAIGQEKKPGDIGKELLMPLSVGDILKAMQDQGIAKGVALSLLSLFGMGLQVYDEKPKK